MNQKQYFRKCFATSRYIYNKCVETYLAQQIPCNHIEYRKHIMKTDKTLSEDEQWMRNVPYDTRQLMIKSFISGMKAAKKNYQNGNISHFSPQFKSRKVGSHIFHIDRRAIKANKKIFSAKGIGNLRFGKKWNGIWNRLSKNGFQHDMTIEKTVTGRYYLIVLTVRSTKTLNGRKPIVALDPGVRTFQTGYDPSGKVLSLGENLAKKEIMPLLKREDLLKSLREKVNAKTRFRMKRRCGRLRTKIGNIINDFQWKCANYLATNYDTILLPSFNVSNMVKKSKRNLSKVSIRSMLSLGHYKFKQKLKHLCEIYRSKLIEVDESYTTQTCTNCGTINKVGGSKIYRCLNCGLTIERDINGSRNILIKTLSELTTKITGKIRSEKSGTKQTSSIKRCNT